MDLRNFGVSGFFLTLLINVGLSSCQSSTEVRVDGPRNMTVIRGRTLRLECIVRNKPDGWIRSWYRNEMRITELASEALDDGIFESRYNIDQNSANYTLSIPEVNDQDDGLSFRCGVGPPGDHAFNKSLTAYVTVNYTPRNDRFSFQPTDWSDFRVGQTVTFQCQSLEVGNPQASLTITSDNIEVDSTLEVSSSKIQRTYTKELAKEDNGKVLQCTLSQEALDVRYERTIGPLVVKYRPMNVAIKVNTVTASVITVDENDLILMQCSAEGNPAPTYAWTVTEAQGCSRGDQHDIKSETLIIKSATMAYNGSVVTCTARNSIGSNSTSAMIIVRNNDENASCFLTTPPATEPPAVTPSKAPTKEGNPVELSTLHYIIIIIAVAFLIVIIILAYIAFSRRRERPIQLTMVSSGNEDTRSIAESIIFHSRHNTPDPELRGNSLGRMQSNFSTMSYDTQSIDSATALMHLKSMESPEYRANPKLTGSPTRKLCADKCGGKEMQMNKLERSPFRRPQMADNVYEGSPIRRGSPPSPPLEKSQLTRQPSEHKYEECPLPLRKYTTHASQTDLAFNDDIIEEENQGSFIDSSDSDEDFDYNPKTQNFSLNNCNIRFQVRHTEV